MMQGVVCDFDARDGVGIIDADDGEVVLINASNPLQRTEPPLGPAPRVEFVAHQINVGFHAFSSSISFAMVTPSLHTSLRVVAHVNAHRCLRRSPDGRLYARGNNARQCIEVLC
jgi:hypothetical protein